VRQWSIDNEGQNAKTVQHFHYHHRRCAFKDEQCRTDKLRGSVEFGPYKGLLRPLSLGFVFPNEYRDQANRLYLYLKNGIGSFKGVETAFRFRLSKDQVFQISRFSIRGRSHSESAKLYEDAILDWTASRRNSRPDLFFVMHPQTPHSEADTPYYACKARLLTEGILSQSVTADLIGDESRLRGDGFGGACLPGGRTGVGESYFTKSWSKGFRPESTISRSTP
jgi:hypothetical protein